MSDDHGYGDDHGGGGDHDSGGDHGYGGHGSGGSHHSGHSGGTDHGHSAQGQLAAEHFAAAYHSDTEFVTAGTALDDDWLTITGTAVVSAAAGTFVQSFVTSLGERAAEEATARTGTLWRRTRRRMATRRGRERREAAEREAGKRRTVEEFRSLVEGLITLQGSGSGVAHLSGPDDVAVLEVHPGLPLVAIEQIRRIDLGSRRVEGRVIVWVSPFPGYPEGVWAERGPGRFRHVWTTHERWAKVRH
ncbi:hypothetical protein [Streptomyces paludis]|uniref:hypothetical protein n=1 Tax=Streptomyces paludis TaxID=2282738 RepID=UPI0015F2D474|nr:hypothetical protein [Streptomyces paludis]